MSAFKSQHISETFRNQNRRLIAKLFLEENWSCNKKSSSPSSEAKADQEFQIKEFSKLPGVLSAYAGIAGLSSRSRLTKLAKKLGSEYPDVRKAAVESLAMIISDSEVYGEKAVIRASAILLKGKTNEAKEMLSLFSIRPDEVASFIDRVRTLVYPAFSKAKQSLKDMLSERGLIPMPKKAENASQPALEW